MSNPSTENKREDGLQGSPLRKFEWGLFVFVVIAACLAVIAYTIAFAGWAVGDPVDWGTFGDYLGGVLNPVIGIITVLLIVLTLATTRKEAADARAEMKAQLAHFKRQEQLNELQRRLDGAMAGWNGFLTTPADGLPYRAMANGVAKRVIEESMAEFIDTANLGQLSALKDSEHARDANKAWRMKCRHGVALMAEIAQYCDDYDIAAGSQILTEFYRRRLFRPAEVFSAIGIIDVSLMHKYFMYEPYLEDVLVAENQYAFALQNRAKP